MRVALYGDSYGVSEKNLESSWVSQLGTLIGSPIDVHTTAGSSLYDAYCKFIDTAENYDLILFIITDPNRYPIEVDFSDNVPFGLRQVSSIHLLNHTREVLKDKLTDSDLETLNNIEGWYNASVPSYVRTVNDLFVDSILNKHSNVILYPSFPFSLTNKKFVAQGLDSKYTFINLHAKQLEKLGFALTLDTFMYIGGHENTDTISEHFVPEFNAFIARMMYDRIMTGEWRYDGVDEIEIAYPKEHYYISE